MGRVLKFDRPDREFELTFTIRPGTKEERVRTFIHSDHRWSVEPSGGWHAVSVDDQGTLGVGGLGSMGVIFRRLVDGYEVRGRTRRVTLHDFSDEQLGQAVERALTSTGDQ